MLALTVSQIKRNIALGQIVQHGEIQYATEMDKELFFGLPIGTPLEIKAKPRRNIMHHRKFFALMKLGQEYWKPDVSLISKPERWIAHRVAKEFAKNSENKDFYELYGKNIANNVLQGVTKERETKLNSDMLHNIDLYRRKIMIDANFCDYILLADGGLLREPWSIAFNKMSQDKFNQIYRGCFNQIWQQTLIQVFDSPEDAEKAINEMMSFV